MNYLILIAVWPFSLVVNACSLTDGTGEFRGIIFSISPPIVSIPKESGVTSNKRLFEPFNNSNPCKLLHKATSLDLDHQIF